MFESPSDQARLVTVLLTAFITILVVLYNQRRTSSREEAKVKLEKLEEIGRSINNASLFINRHLDKYSNDTLSTFSNGTLIDKELLNEALALLINAELLEVIHFNDDNQSESFIDNITKLITATNNLLISNDNLYKIIYLKQYEVTNSILLVRNNTRVKVILGKI